MSCFADADELYELLGGLMREIATDEELGPRLREADTTVQYQYRNPEAVVTTRLEQDAEPQVDFGDTPLEPEVEMSMDADTAHRFWLGKLNVTEALARGEIRASGPVAKVLKLVPLVEPAFPRYRERLEQAGRGDLAEV